MKTPFEPFRIKAVEPIRLGTAEDRAERLLRAGYNLFRVPAEAVAVDLLTDSGTGAMSAEQWAALARGDESYAGSASYARLKRAVEDLFGFEDVVPVHQGRGAERVAFGILCGPGKSVLGNTHFDTTRANIEAAGARAIDLPVPRALVPFDPAPFKGDLDLARLEESVERLGPERVGCVVVTVTNNSVGGHPVSLANLRAVRGVCGEAGIPLLLDAARYAENAFLARAREPALARHSVAEVVRLYFDLCDGFLLSAKKDALCHIGGLLAFRDPALMERVRASMVLSEGFPTYGGLAGRDLEAMAVGLRESVDPDYLEWRSGVARRLGAALDKVGVRCVRPPALHAVYVDAGALLPQVPRTEFPGQALAVELYRVGGVRACDVGTLLRGDRYDGPEMLRLALPRRVYTQSHLDYVVDAFASIVPTCRDLRGFRVVRGDGALRHFTAVLVPAGRAEAAPEARPTTAG